MAFQYYPPLSRSPQQQHQRAQQRQRQSSAVPFVPVSPLIHFQESLNDRRPDTLASQASLRHPYRNDGYDLNHAQLVSPIMSRSPSVASTDRYSAVSGLTSTTYFPGKPHTVHPAPAYVAPFGAVQVVSEHQAARARRTGSDDDDEDARSDKDDVQFSPPALALVNAFLDQLLYSILSTARSTNLAALRPAVIAVLKHRLAKDAIASAEEELRELLAGTEEEDEANTRQSAAEKRRRWDLELVWKRTRLRVMVYMRLGEMEDDDEEHYVKEEELFHGSERRFSQSTGLVSWAAAIFLTSVLEYIAEQTLQVAGQAAYTRARRRSRGGRVATPSSASAPVSVQEYDVEKVALNSTLGRLWRTWRKSLRNDVGAFPDARRMSITSAGRGSVGTAGEGFNHEHGNQLHPRGLDDVPEMQYPEHVLASNIPLPLGDTQKDVDEIEVPGLATDPDDKEAGEERAQAVRRNSYTAQGAYRSVHGLPTPVSISPAETKDLPGRPSLHRQRSMSVPAPARTPMPMEEKMSHTPGAFPETPAVEEPLRIPAPIQEEFEPDHKFNAHEMAAHKRSSLDVKPLLDKLADQAPPKGSAAPEVKSQHTGLVDGAVAGASAAVAATTAMVYGSSKEPETGLTDSDAPEGVDSRVKNRDKRKTMMGMKVFTPPGESGDYEPSRTMPPVTASASQPGFPPRSVRMGSEGSEHSYTLGDQEQQPLGTDPTARRQHMIRDPNAEDLGEGSGIGVARTSEITVASPPHTPSPTMEEQQVRERGRRPARLILRGSPLQNDTASASPATHARPSKSPRDFLESRSLAGKDDSADIQPMPTNVPRSRPAPIKVSHPNKRSSINGSAFTSTTQSPLVGEPANRQSWGPAEQQQQQQHSASKPVPVPLEPTVSSVRDGAIPLEDQLPEHASVQRMVSVKRKDLEEPALTSASIRGPEDFDAFVQGGDTVKYTLTPGTVREQPQVQAQGPVELSSVPSVSRRRLSAPPPNSNSNPTPDTRTGRSSVTKHVTSATPNADRIGVEDQHNYTRKPSRSISRPPPRNTSAHRRSGLMAREPQVMTESTRDFADFIRSTGPRQDQAVAPVMHPAVRSQSSMPSLRTAQSNGSRTALVAGQDRPRSMTRSAIEAENVPPVPPMPVKTKSSMRPRGATGGGRGHAELIDFIRSGPDEQGQHRISRSVAPFRSTMDSDQLQEIADNINGGKAPNNLRLNTNIADAPGQPSARAASAASNRQNVPVTPRSATPNGASHNAGVAVHPAHSGQPQHLASTRKSSLAPSANSDRKRHRNKDPYAIDTDDDGDDDDLLTALPKNRRPEESLMDFLTNNEPPKDNAPRPLVNGSAAQARNPANKPRQGNIISHSADAAGRTNSMQNGAGPRAGYTPSVRSVQSAHSGVSQARPRQSNGGPRPPLPKAKLEARGAGEASRERDAPPAGAFHQGTNDLADFLKNSGPEDLDSAPAPSINRHSKLSPKAQKKEEEKVKKAGRRRTGLGGLFARASRRKTIA